MSTNLCACGCGTPVRKTWAKGHHLRVYGTPVQRRPELVGRIAETSQRTHGTLERNIEILSLFAIGYGYQQIGRMFGISRQCVEQIIKRERVAARHAVLRAVGRGELMRPAACEACQTECFVEAHHEDYSRRLDVRWLCHPCHMTADALRRRRNGESRRLTFPLVYVRRKAAAQAA